jgi:hypothetical protein
LLVQISQVQSGDCGAKWVKPWKSKITKQARSREERESVRGGCPQDRMANTREGSFTSTVPMALEPPGAFLESPEFGQ